MRRMTDLFHPAAFAAGVRRELQLEDAGKLSSRTSFSRAH
jgi:hypothetical protein